MNKKQQLNNNNKNNNKNNNNNNNSYNRVPGALGEMSKNNGSSTQRRHLQGREKRRLSTLMLSEIRKKLQKVRA